MTCNPKVTSSVQLYEFWCCSDDRIVFKGLGSSTLFLVTGSCLHKGIDLSWHIWGEYSVFPGLFPSSTFVLSVKVISSSGKLSALFVQSWEQRDHSQAPRHHRSAAMNDPFSNCTDHTGELPLGCFQTGHMHIILTIDFLWLLWKSTVYYGFNMNRKIKEQCSYHVSHEIIPFGYFPSFLLPEVFFLEFLSLKIFDHCAYISLLLEHFKLKLIKSC